MITPIILGLLGLLTIYAGFRAATDVQRLVSPQGCRMSWMSPSYVLESEFNTSWTPLASRYSLWLYREVGWEPSQAMGLPVLFIPGSAGSSHQVRSIASSAARQYFSSPFVVSAEFTGGAKPLDFYAVEFNEDFSAFHGKTLDAEIAYTSAAVSYILSRYRPGTQIIVMGHSMGGIVGAALLPSDNIKALITMSTPHTLAPARFDPGIMEIYNRTLSVVRGEEQGQTPILSICGGAADGMIPSEACILPPGNWLEGGPGNTSYRRSVFTSALEGAWTGVGHREMVWCHQVRWRIARAALELGATHSVDESARALDRWLRDGSVLPPPDRDSVQDLVLGETEYEALPGNMRLVLNRPLGKRTYLMPIPSTAEEDGTGKFVLYVSQGKVLNIAPRHTLGLHVSVHLCAGRDADATVLCKSLAPTSLRLLPALIPDKLSPVPDEGADESEGVVFFEAEVPHGREGWVGVTIDAGDDGSGWVAGGFDQAPNVEINLGLGDVLFGAVKIPLPRSDHVGSKMEIRFPRLPSIALLAYRLVPKVVEIPSCTAPLFSPLLVHTSEPSEIHYYRLISDHPIFLHTHSYGPYINRKPIAPRGLNLTVHSAGPSCQDVTEVNLSVDWWVSAGRMATRYPTLILGWCIGIVCFMVYHSMRLDGQQLSVGESLVFFFAVSDGCIHGGSRDYWGL
ncbi:PGAP1-like protein-domain-containing protein [Chiua virens]|nr:PGAP1-like protein-domain-containing protein [Chiua virens]